MNNMYDGLGLLRNYKMRNSKIAKWDFKVEGKMILGSEVKDEMRDVQKRKIQNAKTSKVTIPSSLFTLLIVPNRIIKGI